MKNPHNKYSIPFVGLKDGKHVFQYKIDDSFFENFGKQEFSQPSINIEIELIKNVHLFQIYCLIEGTIQSTCDRCCNDLKLELLNNFKLIIKTVSNPKLMNDEESDPDIFYIGFNDSYIHLKEFIYESITLSIPTYKYCTDYENLQCDLKTLKILKKLSN